MSLYTKGTWKRFHVDPAELRTGWETMFSERQRVVFELSALASRAVLVMGGDAIESTIGMNPPHQPRLDCGYSLDQKEIDKTLAPYVVSGLMDELNTTPWFLPEGAEIDEELASLIEDGWGDAPRDFNLFDAKTGVVGFWVVCWSRTDLEDKPSLREDKAASVVGMPYKLLSNDIKKDLFGGGKEWDVMVSRKQVPVIMDLNTGDIWMGSASTKFVKALGSILGRGCGILLTPGELNMGGTPNWVQLALNCIRDKDLYRLERVEAVERELAAEKSVHNPVDDQPVEDVAEADAAQEMEDHRLLSELACWSPDEGGEILVLQADASVSLKPESKSSVTTMSGRDALELFHLHQGSVLQTCTGAIVIPQPTIDNKGPLARISVDFTSELAQGIYRNLEFTSVRSMWEDILEEPYVSRLGLTSVVDSNLSDVQFAPRYSRYWFKYYLQLREFEARLIHGFALACELDPTLVRITARALFAENAPAQEADDEGDDTGEPVIGSENVVKSAVKNLQTSMKKHLLPGESVSLSSPGKAPITLAVADDAADAFIQDIPFMTD